MSRGRSLWAQTWPRLAAVGAVLLVWWGIVETGFFDPTILPPPSAVWTSFREGLADGTLITAAGRSLLRLGFGFGVAVAAGTVIGLAMGTSRLTQRSVGSLVGGLRSLPAIVWLPLAILWLGLTERAIVFVVIIGALPAVAIATAASVRQVAPELVRAGRTLGATGWTLQRRVVLPAALPGYITGVQQGWAFAWWSLVAGELIATGALGLGHLLDTARQTNDIPLLLAVVAIIVVIGVIVELFIFRVVDRHVRGRRGLLAPA